MFGEGQGSPLLLHIDWEFSTLLHSAGGCYQVLFDTVLNMSDIVTKDFVRISSDTGCC